MKIALAGNPNSGKSSLFNHLTGLNQKVGNFPGVTVDKKSGFLKISGDEKVTIIDLPGCYSLYPKSEEEIVVRKILTDPQNEDFPDLVVVVADATNLKRNLLLFTQIHDLNIPVVLALNMMDLVKKRKKALNIDLLKENLNAPVFEINARTGGGLEELKASFKNTPSNGTLFYPEGLTDVNDEEGMKRETLQRYKILDEKLKGVVTDPENIVTSHSKKLDAILTHPIYGYGIFLLLMFIVFQAIFKWAEYPMELIDQVFLQISSYFGDKLPNSVLTRLLTDGIVPGIGGIVIFIPQIAILFAFIGMLEESGYMARVVFLMDRLMFKFGLNGRSVVPLISGIACAVPAIMATRTISSKKDRLATILVTPLMSCSARLPVYTILIALVIPDVSLFGVISLQGVTLFGLYLMGFVAALLASLLIKVIMKSKERSYLVMEMPTYKFPRWGNLGFTILEKTKTFVFEAGKIILAISILLWFAASYGPGNSIEEAIQKVEQRAVTENWSEEQLTITKASAQLEASYAGIFGKSIEPAIRPLGYDWKIGIALISSFAAREVFVGTIATIYSVGDPENEMSIKEKLAAEKDPETGKPLFTLAVGLSLMVFYAFAMQCMSTLAVVYRETKGWKWPVVQLVFMTALAYVSAFVVYVIFR